MMPWGTYSSLSHKHLFSKHALPVVVDRKVGVKEVGKNSIGGLDRFGNDECTSAWGHSRSFLQSYWFFVPIGHG
jgi:hypothetical protein